MKNIKKTKEDLILEIQELERKYASFQKICAAHIPVSNTSEKKQLQQRTEEYLGLQSYDKDNGSGDPFILRLIHELHEQQIVLQMQNSELLLAKEQEELAKEKFTNLFKFAPSAFFILTQNGIIAELNIAGSKMLGDERTNLVNQNFKNFLSFETRGILASFLSKITEGKDYESCDVVLDSSAGIPAYIRINGTLSEDGLHCLVTAIDISDRFQAEKILEGSRELLSRSQKIAKVGTWSLDLKTKHLIWTDEVYRIFGLESTVTEITLETFYDLVHPDDRQELDEAYNGSLSESKNDFESEHRIIRRDTGEIRYVHERCVHERDVNGIIVRSVGMVQDVTEQKIATEEIQWRNEDLRLMNAITQAANKNEELGTIINIIGNQLRKSFNSHLLSVFIPDKGNNEMKMYTNSIDNDFIQKIERLIGRVIPQIHIKMDSVHPFTEIERNRSGMLFVGRTEVIKRLEGYLLGTPWPAVFRKFVKKILPNICDLIGYQSTAATPMIYQEEIVGFIELGSKNIMTDRDLQRIQSVVDHFATVFVRYRTENALKETMEQLNLTNLYLEKRVQERTNEILEISGFQKTILSNAPLAILSTDEHGQVRSLNTAGEKMVGYLAEELIGKTNPLFFHDKEEVLNFCVENNAKSNLTDEELFSSVIKYMLQKTTEWTWIRKDGERFPVRISLNSVLDDHEQLKGYVGLIIDITQEKSFIESLRKREAENRAILQSVPDLMFRIHRDGTYIDSHSQNESSLYVPKDRFIGKKITELLPPDVALQSEHAIDKAFMEGGVQLYEYMLPINGKDCYFENRVIAISEEEVLSIIRDISQRKESESALKMQSAAFESFGLAIIITDANGRIQWVNSAFSRLTGYSVDEAIGQMSSDLVYSGMQDKSFYQQMWDTILNKKNWTGELINRRKDGSLYHEEETITPVLDAQGNISSFIAIKIDISERKKLYQDLADEKRRFADIIKGTNVGTWEWNIQTGETFFNEQWAEIIGYTLDEISPVNIETWAKFAHPDDLKASNELLQKHFQGVISYYSFESRMKHKNGEWIWVLDSGKVHEWDNEGNPLLMSGTHQDITERKRASAFESELLQLSLHLTGIPVSEIAPALNMALERIGSFLGADRAYIFEINTAANTMSNTFEWCNDGITSHIDSQKDIPCGIFPSWMTMLKQQESIIVPFVKDLPSSWKAAREILEPQGIQSLILIPMFLENTLIGFVGLDSVKSIKEYKETEVNILKVWGNMLASLLKHQRTESYIELMRQNYETFFNTIDDFLFVLDQQGNIIHTNTTVKRRLGYNNGELFGKSVLMVHPSERRDEAARIVGEMLSGKAEYCPVPLVTKCGDHIPVETRVKHGFWDDNPVIFGVSKDISQIKLSEEKFSKAFQSNSALMAISTLDGRFLDVNNTFIQTLGYSREEVIGNTSGGLNLFDNPSLRTSLTDLLVKDIAVREIELRARTKSGSEIFGLFSGDLITIGKEKCLLTMLVDITERKLAENEIIKAKREAEKANLAKSEFLSRMSHELRTPLNSILGYSQLLEMGELSPKQKKGVNHILNSGKHLLDLINEVLDIAGIEAGRQILTYAPVQLSVVINEIADLVQVEANKRNITIEFSDSQNTNVFALADKFRLKQVLLNLLSNAVKYNRNGGVITIFIEPQSTSLSPNPKVRTSIRDTGLGIKPEDINKLFQPFERIGADKTEIEGTGLGLMVVKKLTEAMGGSVGVESIPGSGSTFWIDLPLTEKMQSGIMQSNDRITVEPPATKQSITILYIEDNLSNIELMEEILTDYRPEIQLVTSIYGGETMNLVKECNPDLIFLDLDLPDIHGTKVLETLLTDSQTLSIPVIIISADAMPKQVERLMKAGAAGYLTKPLDVTHLLKTIDQQIKFQSPSPNLSLS